jgi:hypothetical protein
MRCWRSRLARLNNMFDSYIKENYKVVDYHVKTPSLREHCLTWRPYGYYKRRKSRMARSRCIALWAAVIIEARPAMNKERKARMEFDTDSFDILIDNCCSHTLTNDINDYIEPPVKSTVRVRGFNGSTNSTMVGTVKWKIKDDNGKMHNFILPNTYYSSSVETRLLSPQHWAQTRNKGRDSYCVTYHDAIIMRWNKDKYQITAPLDNRKHRNVGVVRSAPGIKKYLTACQAIDQEYTTLAHPATICMDCQAAEITNDESSVQVPEKSDVDQMREKIFKVKEPETMIQDEDTTVEEDSPTYSQDSQEYMHWHYRLNHPTHTVMLKMAKQKMLPRRITKILTDMGKLHIKAPMCNDCCGAKATRRPWRNKESKHKQSHIKRPTHPGEVVSVDQLESSVPGFIGQMTGRLTKQRIMGSTIFVDHASDLSYVYHQTSMTSEETLKSKLAFEKFALSHGVHIKHYHADNGRLKDTLFTRDIEEKGQTISYCGVGAHHQNGIAEKRLGDLQRTATALLLHAQRGGQMQLTHTCGLMPSGQQTIAGIMHQPMSMTLAQCQGFVQPVVYQQSKISITLDVQHMS